MSLRRTLVMVVNEIKMGPRSSIFLWALMVPAMMTLLMQVVFMTLFDPAPRLAIADLGDSQITREVQQMEGIELTLVEDAASLKALVEANDVDAGLVLAEGFDRAVKAGERPTLEFYVSGESVVINRIVLSVTTLDLVRQIEGAAAPVEVVLHQAGKEMLHISKRLIPALILFALMVAGIFVPAYSLVGEKEQRTLDALLVTPVKLSEVMLSKALLGFGLAIVLAYLTLALNGVLADQSLAMLVTLAVAALMCVSIGLLYGTLTKDAKSMYTLAKSLNILIFGPVIFYIFPSWPQWIAKLFPTYWFIDPIYQVSIKGAEFADVWAHLAVALGITAAIGTAVIALARRMQLKWAAG